MPFPDAVFRHAPALKGRIVPPAKSLLRLTYERFDELDAQALAEGWPPGWRMEHEAREANRREVLAGRLDQDLWVFGYGSLIWDPAVYLDEIRLATLDGWHRRFCMLIHGGRGTIANPGLMAALDKGGVCEGVAFRIPGEIVDEESEIMWMREMFGGSYRPEFQTVSTPQGEIEALAFVIDPDHDRYIRNMSLADAAKIIAHAEGRNGTNFEYLESLQTHLACLGLEDAEMAELHRLAEEMRGPAGAVKGDRTSQ